MSEIVPLERPIVWACNCGCPRMWAYRDGRLKCSECEQWQSFDLPESDSLIGAATEMLAAFDAIIQQCGHDTCPRGWLSAANRMRQLLREHPSPTPEKGLYWKQISSSDPYCANCGRTWDMHIAGCNRCPNVSMGSSPEETRCGVHRGSGQAAEVADDPGFAEGTSCCPPFDPILGAPDKECDKDCILPKGHLGDCENKIPF